MAPVLLNPYRFAAGGGGGGYSAEVLADSPLMYWRHGEASGTQADDSSGNARHGTYASSPTLGVAGALSDGNTAISVTGGSRADIADAAWMEVPTFSVEIWAKPSTVAAGQVAIAARHSLGGMCWDLLRNGSSVEWRLKNSADTAVQTLTASSVLSTSAWTHIAGTFDGTDMRIYIGGSIVGSPLAASTRNTASQNVGVTSGALTGNYASIPFSGDLDEFAYYSGALSSARISAHFAAA